MKNLVIKCGGSIVDQLPDAFYKNIAALAKAKGVNPIIVHGGGPMISSHLKQMNVATTFVDGLRVTTHEVLDVVEMVLSGSINKQMVRKLNEQQGKAVGISGVDGNLLVATPIGTTEKIGYVGQVEQVNTPFIKTMIKQDYIPVISPIAIGPHQQRYNVNADTAAAAIASALSAPLCFVSDIDGIYVGEEVLRVADPLKIEQLIADQVINGGMIPKVRGAIDALKSGVTEVAILNGMNPNSIAQFINGATVGTRIYLKEVAHA
ncbi:acetylglutamate kinase [Amphibacillus cookii]|uniref:acetylglutamate kinase n=1 Tax=Amphibacillus cookii TaxID=767787 RepID=UPI00195E9056|nr:acetylglutamate kinase [Amphibacillus cookii]